jgi:transcription antitermination protein NusB
MRRLARELSLQILFQTEFSTQVNLTDLAGLVDGSYDNPTWEYAMEIVNGVKAHREAVDNKISSASSHWKIDRMASVDRNILRLATYEMVFGKEKLDPKIVINEAIEIAKIFGSADSGAFVNGLLDQIAKNENIKVVR